MAGQASAEDIGAIFERWGAELAEGAEEGAERADGSYNGADPKKLNQASSALSAIYEAERGAEAVTWPSTLESADWERAAQAEADRAMNLWFKPLTADQAENNPVQIYWYTGFPFTVLLDYKDAYRETFVPHALAVLGGAVYELAGFTGFTNLSPAEFESRAGSWKPELHAVMLSQYVHADLQPLALYAAAGAAAGVGDWARAARIMFYVQATLGAGNGTSPQWLREVVECVPGTVYYLEASLGGCTVDNEAVRLHGYILNHNSTVYAIDPEWDGIDTEGIMKRARAVHVVPDRKGSQGAPLSWDALLALLAYKTAFLTGEEDPAANLLNALLTIERDKKAHEEAEHIEAMPRKTSTNHHTTDPWTHALTSFTLYGQAQTPEPKAIKVADKTKRNAPAVVNAYLQTIQEMPTSRHLTTLHETVLAAITSLFIEAPYKNILWGDIAYQMGYSDHPREMIGKIAQCCKDLADAYTVTDWTGAGRIGSLTDEVRGKRGIMWRIIDVGWVYENGEIIGINLGGRPPANLRFSQQMNNQIDTFPRARLLYGIDKDAGERMTEQKQYIAYKLEDHINTMNHSRKIKAGETYTVRLIASAAHPERPGLLEEAGVNVNDSGRKKRAVDYVRRVLDGHLAEGTIAGYKIVKEGRKIAKAEITKKGRARR